MSDSDFSKLVESHAVESPASMAIFYDVDADFIEFVITRKNYRARRIDSRLTVYEDRETGDLVGGILKGIKSLLAEILKQLPGFAREFSDNQLPLGRLLTARMWTAPKDEVKDTRPYHILSTQADNKHLRVAVPC